MITLEFASKMAPGVEKTTTKLKYATKSEHPVGAPHGHHPEQHGEGSSHERNEGESKSSHTPLLCEQPGATQTSKLDGSGLRIAIVASRWYEKVVHSLVETCSEELLAKGVAEDDLHVVEVAGAFELPFTAARMVHCKDTSRRPDAVICIGCIVNEGTRMCENMGHAVANGIMKLNVTSDTPVIFGVLCCDNESQAHSCAEKRSSCGGGEGRTCNHGVLWAQSALEMAYLKRCISAKKVEHCCCTRCVGRGSESDKHQSEKQPSSKHDVCTSCGSTAKECTCKDCKCQVCCDHSGVCASCKSSADNCMCKDCKCRSCCNKRAVCRGCGCPPDKCSCEGCNCVACSSNKEDVGKKLSPRKHATKQKSASSSEDAGKHEASTSSSSFAHGGSDKCASCGSPGGQCKCGLLH